MKTILKLCVYKENTVLAKQRSSVNKTPPCQRCMCFYLIGPDVLLFTNKTVVSNVIDETKQLRLSSSVADLCASDCFSWDLVTFGECECLAKQHCS